MRRLVVVIALLGIAACTNMHEPVCSDPQPIEMAPVDGYQGAVPGVLVQICR